MPAAAVKTRIGFVTGGKSSMPHYRSFLPLVPEDVVLDFHGSDLCGASLYEIADKKEFIVSRVTELAAANAWRGVISPWRRPKCSIGGFTSARL